MRTFFLFSLFLLSSCNSGQGVYRNYIISQSRIEDPIIMEEECEFQEND